MKRLISAHFGLVAALMLVMAPVQSFAAKEESSDAAEKADKTEKKKKKDKKKKRSPLRRAQSSYDCTGDGSPANDTGDEMFLG